MVSHDPRPRGRRKTCDCGVCKKCNHRLYMRTWTAGKSGLPCSVDGCDRLAYAKGLCNKHYQAARKKIPEVREHRRTYHREYCRKPEQAAYSRAYIKNRLATDPNFKLAHALRVRINRAVKTGKAGSAVKDLGCSIEDLRSYLEAKFEPGMSWDNMGRSGWHIDHIQPLSSFDLSDRQQFAAACHFTNLQPLWEFDNLSKNSNEVVDLDEAIV